MGKASCSKLTASFFDKPALPRRAQHSKQRIAASAGPGQLFRRQMQTACSQQYFSTTLPLRCTRLGTQAAYPISIAERAHVCKIAAAHWSPPLGHICTLVIRVDGPDTEVKTGPQKGRSPSKPNNTCTHGHDMSDCENTRFTEKTSTNLGRSHRLPHVCTIMIYGKLGGYRLQECDETMNNM